MSVNIYFICLGSPMLGTNIFTSVIFSCYLYRYVMSFFVSFYSLYFKVYLSDISIATLAFFVFFIH